MLSASVSRMQAEAVDISFCRRICDEFRVTGSLESKDGRMGFRARVMVDFLTCENGFSASIGQKFADSRFDAVSRIGKMLVKSDLIHHYRDALEFGDDDGFFRFLDDEPALYFENRQTVLSLRSPFRPVRAGQVLWMCEDILLGSDLEVRNKARACHALPHSHFIRFGTAPLYCSTNQTAPPSSTPTASFTTSARNLASTFETQCECIG